MALLVVLAFTVEWITIVVAGYLASDRWFKR